MSSIDVLIPTIDRSEALAMTLAGVASQSLLPSRLLVADQSSEAVSERPVITTLLRVLEVRGVAVECHHRPRVHGIAEQRDFLLGRARGEAVLMLDDDVFMEPWVLEALHAVLESEGIGFVGAFPAGLSYREAHPESHAVEYWEGPVTPEVVEPDGPGWERARLHAAANLHHAARNLPLGGMRRYKVAWVGACALYDRAKLEEVGGFGFWRQLPADHAGEEVLVQNLLLRRWGGCAILPSGTYHAEVPTTIDEQGRAPEANAINLLPDMLERRPG